MSHTQKDSRHIHGTRLASSFDNGELDCFNINNSHNVRHNKSLLFLTFLSPLWGV